MLLKKTGVFWASFFSVKLLAASELIDLGTEGHTFEIKEVSLLEVIQNKLKHLDASGRLETLTQELQEKAQKKIQEPAPVPHLKKTEKERILTFDPSYIAPRSLYDEKGKRFIQKGQKVNPLDTLPFGEPLLFIDGSDPDQVSLTLREPAKVILVKGRPLDLEKKMGKPIYFDQGGFLSKKLHLTHVPALVYQEGKVLKIKEIKV